MTESFARRAFPRVLFRGFAQRLMNGLITLLAFSLSASELRETAQRACLSNASAGTARVGLTMAPECSDSCGLVWLDTQTLDRSTLDAESRFALETASSKCDVSCPPPEKLSGLALEVRKLPPLPV